MNVIHSPAPSASRAAPSATVPRSVKLQALLMPDPAAARSSVPSCASVPVGAPSRHELGGQNDVSAVMIYAHALNSGPAAVRSPADRMVLS